MPQISGFSRLRNISFHLQTFFLSSCWPLRRRLYLEIYCHGISNLALASVNFKVKALQLCLHGFSRPSTSPAFVCSILCWPTGTGIPWPWCMSLLAHIMWDFARTPPPPSHPGLRRDDSATNVITHSLSSIIYKRASDLWSFVFKRSLKNTMKVRHSISQSYLKIIYYSCGCSRRHMEHVSALRRWSNDVCAED